VQILLESRIPSDRVGGEECRAGDQTAAVCQRRIVVLRRRVPAECRFVKIRHAVAIGIHRRRGGVERAKTAVARARLRYIGDVVPTLSHEVVNDRGSDLIPQRLGCINLEP
jgi:hypothetical protein